MPREARKLSNRVLFREVNERIADLANGSVNSGGAFICECADTGCTARVEVPLDAYQRVRDDEDSFLVVPGHEDALREGLVERHESFLIVRSRVPNASATGSLDRAKGAEAVPVGRLPAYGQGA